MVLIIAFYLLISPHFLGGTRTSTQGFTLARQVLYFLSHTSNPFCSCYFGGRVSIFAQAGLDCDPILHFTGMTDAQDHSWLFYIEMGSQVCLFFFFFCLGWPGNAILPISASFVAGMTGRNYYVQVMIEMRSCELFSWDDLKPQASPSTLPKLLP
jgi:hypothetical protein